MEEFLIAPWLHSKSYDIEGRHVGISRTWECQATARRAPGPPWSAVEDSSTHPHDVRLRRALHDGNEVISRCGAPERNVSTSAGNCFVGFDGGLAIRMVLRRGGLQIRANSKVACSTGLDPQILQARCPVLPGPRHIREAQPFRFLLHSL